MGIVLKQSFRNTIIIYGAFLIGGINTIIFYIPSLNFIHRIKPKKRKTSFYHQ